MLLYLIPFLLVSVICEDVDEVRAQRECLRRFKTGPVFDLNQLIGDWYPVYYWPARNALTSCSKVTFTESRPKIDCEIPVGEKVIKSIYTPDNEGPIIQYFYGAGDIKHLSSAVQQYERCDFFDGIFTEVGSGYVLATLCSHGSSVLLSRRSPTRDELMAVVNSIGALKNVDGTPQCLSK